MTGLNLSEWALKHRSLTAYLMIIAVMAGAVSYIRLGRSEDPSFVIKTMVVQAAWPGATIEDTLNQVTERLERTLQETPKHDFLRSYTRPGVTTIFVNLDGSTTANEVADIWYHVRKSIGDIRHTLPAGIVGPGFNDEFGDTFGIIYGFTADGFTHRDLRDYVEAARSKLLQVPDVSKIEILGAQDEKIFVEFSMRELASLGIDRSALIGALQAQNIVQPAGTIQTGYEKLLLRVSGAFRSEQDVLDVNFVVGGRILRLSDIAQVRRGYADPPQPLFRVDGEPAIGLAIAMRDGGDILALGNNVAQAMAEITADLPVGIEPKLVADQAVTVKSAIAEFMTSLWQAIAIILVVSFISLGVRPGLIIALSIPLTLAIVFAVMDLASIDMQRISLGALIIALALLVDDAMTTTDATLTRLAAGDDKVAAATFAFRTYAFAMLAGTLVTMAGFVPVGFAASSAGEYTFSLFAVVSIALIVSWFVAVIFAPLLGVVILKPPAAAQTAAAPGKVFQLYSRFLTSAMQAKWVTIALTLVLFAASFLAMPLIPRQFFPSSDRPELLVDLSLPQNASIYASEAVARRFDSVLKGDPDVARWSTYVGRGAIRFYLPLNVQLPNDFFTQSVIVAKDVAARERLRVKLEKTLADDFPEHRRPRLPAGTRTAGRMAGTIPGERSGCRPGAGDRFRPCPDCCHQPASHQRQLRLDRTGAASAHPRRPERGAAAGSELTGSGRRAQHGHIGQRCHRGARRYLSGRRDRARHRRAARLARDPAHAAGAAAERAHRSAQPVCDIRYEQDYPLIWRRDRVPTLTVQADVAPGTLPETVVGSLSTPVEALAKSLPRSYRIAVGGTVEESRKSQASVIAVVPVMLLIMLTVLMVELKKLSAPVPGAQRGAAWPDRRRGRAAPCPASRSASLPFSEFWRCSA